MIKITDVRNNIVIYEGRYKATGIKLLKQYDLEKDIYSEDYELEIEVDGEILNMCETMLWLA